MTVTTPIVRWIAVLLLGWSAVAAAESPVNTTFFGNIAIEGYDAVAYHTENKAVKGKSDFNFDWQGAHWRFANAENLALFKADPEKYAPQYGGYCAYAMARGEFAGIDPRAFTLVDGKLYLNYSPDIQKTWSADRDNYIHQADQHWPDLLKK